MSATERLQAELAFHDEQAAQRRRFIKAHPATLIVESEWYLDHEPWVRPAFHQLGELQGKHVLDYGCGHGMASVVLAKRGALVAAFDLSAGYAAEAQDRAWANHVNDSVDVVQSSAELLPFATGTFDAVWGHAILHHLDLERAATELARVLKPAGVAVFCEPWGENPLLEWARQRWAYSGKHRSAGEKPMRRNDLRLLRRYFRSVQCQPFQLLSMARRVWSRLPLQGTLVQFDAAMLARWPSLGRFCRYMMLSLRK